MKFSELNISENVKKALEGMHIVDMFPIQEQAIPTLLEGRDLVGQAQTGTGKTAAFTIPIIERIDISKRYVQAIILCPTRELAVQVSDDIQNIGRYTGVRTLAVYGGASMNTQIDILKSGVQVVVGTPGRVLDHLRRGTLRLNNVTTFVLDEADRMLDMGFIDDVESIIRHAPRQRQTMMFSATMPDEIKNLAKKYMVNYNFISVSADEITVKDIQQLYCDADFGNKFDTLKELIKKEKVFSAIIFCNSRSIVAKVMKMLKKEDINSGGLYGDLSQAQRNRTLELFKRGKIHILVATDLASRGLNIPDVSHVINYSVPKDPKQYIHRIGRTGRARKSGKAITLVTREDRGLWHAIKNLVDMPIERIDYLPIGYVSTTPLRQQKPQSDGPSGARPVYSDRKSWEKKRSFGERGSFSHGSDRGGYGRSSGSSYGRSGNSGGHGRSGGSSYNRSERSSGTYGRNENNPRYSERSGNSSEHNRSESSSRYGRNESRSNGYGDRNGSRETGRDRFDRGSRRPRHMGSVRNKSNSEHTLFEK